MLYDVGFDDREQLFPVIDVLIILELAELTLRARVEHRNAQAERIDRRRGLDYDQALSDAR
ncbi:MAG: hypothetical protein NVS2B17_28530 [Candidatus Velthaea sp.]